MAYNGWRVLAMAGFAALVCIKGSAQQPPSLGSAASFAVLGDSVAIESGPTHISGNLGATSGRITGVAPVMRVGDVRNDLAGDVRRDAARAYDELATRTCREIVLDAQPIPSGVYCVASTAAVTETVTLDARNIPDSIWIFRTTGPLVFAAAMRVLVINGGHDANVFWRVGGSARLGENVAFIGNLLTASDITLDRGATVSGRLLARNGTVTLNANEVSLCCAPITVFPAALPGGVVGISYNQTITAEGGTESFTMFERTSGVIPEGLTISPNGTVSGMPMFAGTYRFTATATDSHRCAGTREYTIVVSCGPTPLDLSLEKRDGVYFAVASGGTPPYRYGVPGGFSPAGIVIDARTGVITLRPGACSTRFTITVTDAGRCSTSRTFTFCLITILPETLPDGTVGVEYDQTLSACGAKEFRNTDQKVPGGIKLDPNGKLHEMPTTAGTFTFTVTTNDDLSCTASRSYTLRINPGPNTTPITILPPTLPNGIVGTLYEHMLVPDGGVGPPYGFSPADPARSDVTLSSSGLLSGIPTTPGIYKFTVRVTDRDGAVGVRDYQIVICGNLSLSPAILPNANACEAYYAKLDPVGGVAPYRFEARSGTLPADLNLNPYTGEITGNPRTPSQYTVVVTVTDALAEDGCPTREFSLPLRVDCHVTISPAPLPGGVVGVGYSEQPTACGGSPDYTFAVTAGSLPPLLSLSADGLLFGTPTTAGSYTFTVTATDSKNCSGNREYTIVVLAVPPGGAVPTLSEWGIVGLLGLLAVFGVIAVRKT